MLDRLREIDHGIEQPHAGSRALVLEYGIGHHEWIVAWCDADRTPPDGGTETGGRTMRLSTTIARPRFREPPGRTIAAWGVVLVLSVAAIATMLGSSITTDDRVSAPTDSRRAERAALANASRTRTTSTS